ncbi:MAG: DUF1501 domain-containing protein [Fuerstiella sp.]
MKRREFLKTTSAGAAVASAGLIGPQLVAQQRSPIGLIPNPVLVMVYLRGGHDQLNTFVPHSDRTYYKIRPTIAIPKPDVIQLDSRWGLHPAMEPLKRFYDEGRFAAVINSGSPHPTRSHFDAQDFMEFAAPGNRSIRDGWLNRYLFATKNPRGEDPEQIRAIALQERLPRSMRGSYPAVAVPPNLREIDEVLDLFEDFYRGGDPDRLRTTIDAAQKPAGAAAAAGISVDPVMASGTQTIQYLRRLRQLLYGDVKPTYGSSRADSFEGGTFQEYPGGWFASRLKAAARIIKADVGLQVVGTDINGWDHHIGLGSVDGTLNRMLEFVSTSLAAFMDDLGPELDRTLILVSTEFGRVCGENGNDGSDHGHGGATWLLGGRVKGGRIYGKWTGLEPSELNQKRDLKVTTDFREIYADVLRQHMGFDLPKGFFPDYTPLEKGLGIFG